jgi:hypothetical protein
MSWLHFPLLVIKTLDPDWIQIGSGSGLTLNSDPKHLPITKKAQSLSEKENKPTGVHVVAPLSLRIAANIAVPT